MNHVPAGPAGAILGLLFLGACVTPERRIPPAAEAPSEPAQGEVPRGRTAVDFTPYEVPEGEADPLRIQTERVPYPAFDLERPEPVLELGDPFLGNGPLQPGIRLATGQMIQPQFLLYGAWRNALQVFDDGDFTRAEWASRLDLHADWKLSGTERFVASFRPLDSDRGEFTGYEFWPEEDNGFRGELNARPTALFFEGELGEMFPGLDPEDRRRLDVGFSVGRQNLVVQDGLLVNDIVDMVGVTQNSLVAPGVSNMRLTGIFGWGNVNRGDNREEESATLLGILAAADAGERSVSADLLFVNDHRDQTSAWYFGAGSTQRFGALNSTLRAVASLPVHEDRPEAGTGALFFSELSKTLTGSDNLAYANAFLSLNDFTSAARGDDRAGPVGRTGLLFEPVGMGRYGQPLGGSIEDTVGGSLGLQMFLDGTREQLIFEVGGLDSYEDEGRGALGVGARYERAFGAHSVLRIDGFAVGQEDRAPGFGARIEWVLEF